MTALAQMTRSQKMVGQMNQADLDDPTQHEMIVGAWNQATGTYIYYHEGWQLYYNYHNPNCGYWTARNIKMDLCFEFDRDELIETMLSMMDQAASDGDDWLLSGLPPTLPDTPEEWQSAAQRYGLEGEV